MGLIQFAMMLTNQARSQPEPEPEPEPEANPEFAWGDYIDFPAKETMLDSGTVSAQTEQLWTQRLIYHNGKTYYVYVTPTEFLPYGQARLMVFDNVKGFDIPVTVGNCMSLHPVVNQLDTHQVPSMIIAKDPNDNIDKVYISQERTHITPFEVYKDIYGDCSRFDLSFYIGLNLAYANYIEKPNGGILCWTRGGDEANSPGQYDDKHHYSIYVIDSDNGFEGLDTAVPKRITDRPAAELWHYPGVPWGYYRDSDGWYHFAIGRRTGFEPTPDTVAWHRFYHVKTQDFDTFYNNDESWSKSVDDDGIITDSELYTNCLVHETDDISTQGRQICSGLSSDGHWYQIQGSYNGDGSYVFIYYDDDGEIVKKPIDIPNIRIFLTEGETIPGERNPNGAFFYIMAFARDDIRVVCYRTIGGYDRPYLYRTTDLGDTWEGEDMAPDITDVSLLCLLPNNIMRMPNNTNTFAVFTYPDPDASGYRRAVCRVLAWNNIQPIPGATSPTAATEMNYNSTGLFHYKCNDAGLTKSGNNVTALIDQFGIRNATCANNPQWNGSNKVTFLSASSQWAKPATPESLVDKGALTFMAVVEFSSGVNSHILSFSNTANTNAFLSYRTVAANVLGTHPATFAWQLDKAALVDTASAFGHRDISSGPHLLSVSSDGRAGLMISVDGQDQYLQVTGADTIEEWECIGKGPSHMTSVANVVTIGGIDRSADTYTNLVLYEMVLWSGVMPFTERKAREKKLCDDYGITFINQFQVP